MHRSIQAANRGIAAKAAFAAAALILALEPVSWLAGTWRDPAYDSDGFAGVTVLSLTLVLAL